MRPIDADWIKSNLNKVFRHECDQLYGMMQLIDEAPTLTPPNEWVSVEDDGGENNELRADLARVTAERDAAIECLKNKCPFCRKYLTCQGRTINNDCWEFFGLKED